MSASPSSPKLRQHADRLWFAAGVVLASMPIAMVVAPRSSAPFVAVGAGAAISAAFLEGSTRRLITKVQLALRTPVGLSAIVFLSFAVASTAWSVAPVVSIAAYTSFILIVASAFVLALALPGRVPGDKAPLLAVIVGFACVLIIIDLWTGLAGRRALGMHAEPFIFNRTALTILVLSMPIAWLLFERGEAAIALAFISMVAWTIFTSESGAAALGCMIAPLVYVIARRRSAFAVTLVGACLLSGIALAPFLGEIVDTALPSAVHDMLASSNSRARVDIWKAYGAAARAEPLVGSGFGVSPHFSLTSAASRVSVEYQALLGSHPHNAALQIWVELGAIGALLAAILVACISMAISRLPPGPLACSLSLFATVGVVSLVAHGAWQAWWPATIGVAVTWMRCGMHDSFRSEGAALKLLT